VHNIQHTYAPSGIANVKYTFRQAGSGPLVKQWTIEPQGMNGTFDDFPYPVKDVRGLIWFDTSKSPLRNIRLDLNGQVGDTRAVLRGTVKGERGTGEIDLSLHSDNVLLDGRIMKALPARAQDVARQFLSEASRTQGLAACPLGRADVRATFRRQAGR